MAKHGRKSKTKKINPCKAKGLYGGSYYAGVDFKVGGQSIPISGCECGQPFFDLGRESEVATRYAYGLEDSEFPGELIPLKDSKRAFSPRTLEVVPCAEKFRFQRSIGTKFFTDAMGSLTSFRGCQVLEEDLMDRQLVTHRPPKDEILGWQEPTQQDEPSTETEVWEVGLDPEVAAFQYSKDLVEQLIDLVPYFRNALEEDEVQRPTPEPWATIEKNGPSTLGLTNKQKSAILALYPDSGPRIPYSQAAKKLRISVESLKDRIKGAKKKVFIRFPNLKPKPEIRNLHRSPDHQMDGFFVRSQAEIIRPLFRVSPKTGQKTLMQPRKEKLVATKAPKNIDSIEPRIAGLTTQLDLAADSGPSRRSLTVNTAMPHERARLDAKNRPSRGVILRGQPRGQRRSQSTGY